jgi:hypothetical protein
MAVLKFGAVNLDDGTGIPEKRFRHCLNHARLAGAGGPKKKQVADWTSGSVQARKKHLVNLNDFFDRGVLADNLPPQGGFKVLRVRAAPSRIKSCIKAGPHKFLASICRGRLLILRGINLEMGATAAEL